MADGRCLAVDTQAEQLIGRDARIADQRLGRTGGARVVFARGRAARGDLRQKRRLCLRFRLDRREAVGLGLAQLRRRS
jgi:hypothetical protein